MKKLTKALIDARFVQTDEGRGWVKLHRVLNDGDAPDTVSFWTPHNTRVSMTGVFSLTELRALAQWLEVK